MLLQRYLDLSPGRKVCWVNRAQKWASESPTALCSSNKQRRAERGRNPVASRYLWLNTESGPETITRFLLWPTPCPPLCLGRGKKPCAISVTQGFDYCMMVVLITAVCAGLCSHSPLVFSSCPLWRRQPTRRKDPHFERYSFLHETSHMVKRLLLSSNKSIWTVSHVVVDQAFTIHPSFTLWLRPFPFPYHWISIFYFFCNSRPNATTVRTQQWLV